MPIKDYTTQISVAKTAGEIQEILSKAGAHTVVIEYGPTRVPETISFQINVNDQTVSFRLPSRWSGVHTALVRSNCDRKYKSEEHARRVAWRIIKDWCEAQMAIIEAGAAELSEVFLPYMVDPRTDKTMFDNFKGQFLLKAGETVDGVVL